MFDWAKRKSPEVTRLAGLLAIYPAYTPPHIGQNGAAPVPGQPTLTLGQCHENLDALLRAMPERLALLGGLLAELGVDSAQAYANPEAFVTRLHATLLKELPPLYRPDLAKSIAREVSTRAGRDIVLSLMADLALLEADILMHAKPGCFIGLDLDPGDREMLSWRRPCLLGLVDRFFPDGGGDVFHLEDEWFGIYSSMDHPGRLAAPDRVMPETWGLVIGGSILERLDRNIVDPRLDEKLQTGWLGKAR